MFSSLIMSNRTEFSCFGFIGTNAIDITIKGKIEVEPGLLAIGNGIQSCCSLVMYSSNDSVFDHLFHISGPKFIQVLTGKLKPSGKRVAANYSSSQNLFFHNLYN